MSEIPPRRRCPECTRWIEVDDWHVSGSGHETCRLTEHTVTGAAISNRCRCSGVYVPDVVMKRAPPGVNPRQVRVTKRFLPGRSHAKKV